MPEVTGLPDLSTSVVPQSQALEQTFTVETVATGAPQLLQQLRGLQGQSQNCSFGASHVGSAGSIRDTYDFQHCLITEVTTPAMDATEKDAVKMTIKISPEWREQKHGQSAGTPAPRGTLQPAPSKSESSLWKPLNFKLELPGSGEVELKKVEGLPSATQLTTGEWGSIRLEGPATKTRSQMLEWYQQLLKQPPPRSCSIVANYSSSTGSASRRYDFNNCLLNNYCLTCLEGSSDQECEEIVSIQVARSDTPLK